MPGSEGWVPASAGGASSQRHGSLEGTRRLRRPVAHPCNAERSPSHGVHECTREAFCSRECQFAARSTQSKRFSGAKRQIRGVRAPLRRTALHLRGGDFHSLSAKGGDSTISVNVRKSFKAKGGSPAGSFKIMSSIAEEERHSAVSLHILSLAREQGENLTSSVEVRTTPAAKARNRTGPLKVEQGSKVRVPCMKRGQHVCGFVEGWCIIHDRSSKNPCLKRIILPGEIARDSWPCEEACNLLPEKRAMNLVLEAEARKWII